MLKKTLTETRFGQNGCLAWVSGQKSDGEITMFAPRSRCVRFSDCEIAWIARLRWSVVRKDGMRALKAFNS